MKILLEWLSLGYVSDENLSLLAVKLLAIRKRCDPEDLVELYKVFPITLEDFAEKIMNALDSGKLPPFISPSNDNTVRMDLAGFMLEKPRKLVVFSWASPEALSRILSTRKMRLFLPDFYRRREKIDGSF